MAYKWIVPCSTMNKTKTKMTAKSSMIVPVIGKLFCSPSEIILVVRNRPQVVNGGGFVVTNPKKNHKIVFMVDGCGVLGKKEEVILKDADGTKLLIIRRKGGIVEAVSLYKRWNGYKYNLSGSSQELVFCLKDPKPSCLNKNSPIKISIRSNACSNLRDFEIVGYFPDRDCTIVEQSTGIVVAQVGVRKEVGQVMTNKDLYHVIIKPGIDQAFVFGVIAVLDYIYDGSTTW
ncbi:hypothetical protein LIER_00937 [Lithospermum erythrorhizon]|uniref:Protein LURP-one-related 6 n=1 Tax=Lithospermum erythrorhizon TaxID=34254 RepID=A0AAV3NJ67_LITER